MRPIKATCEQRAAAMSPAALVTEVGAGTVRCHGSQSGLLRPNPRLQAIVPVAETVEEVSPEADELLTDEQVCKILKVKKQWLRDHTTRVEPIVPHIPMGRQIRYSKRALYTWIEAQIEIRPTWERNRNTA